MCRWHERDLGCTDERDSTAARTNDGWSFVCCAHAHDTSTSYAETNVVTSSGTLFLSLPRHCATRVKGFNAARRSDSITPSQERRAVLCQLTC